MLQVGALRMRRHEYELAARDFAHVLEMSRCLYGPRSSALIPLAERLCKAHVLLRRWREARDALELAHELAISKHGPEHAEVRRIEAVLRSLDKYAPPRTSVGAQGLGGISPTHPPGIGCQKQGLKFQKLKNITSQRFQWLGFQLRSLVQNVQDVSCYVLSKYTHKWIDAEDGQQSNTSHNKLPQHPEFLIQFGQIHVSICRCLLSILLLGWGN